MHLDTCWCINSVYIQNCGSFFFIVVFSNIFKGDIIGFYPLIILRLTLDLSWSNRSHTEMKYFGIIQVCKAQYSWVSTFLLVRGDVISWVSYAMAPEKTTLTWFTNYGKNYTIVSFFCKLHKYFKMRLLRIYIGHLPSSK